MNSTFLHVATGTPTRPVVYAWDGEPASHPLRLLRVALGWEKAMRLAKATGLDRLDINAVEKGKNKGGTSRIVNALANVLFLTPWQMADLLEFHLHPDDAIQVASERQLEGSIEWAKYTGLAPVAEVRPTVTPHERARKRLRISAQQGVRDLRRVRGEAKAAKNATRTHESAERRSKRRAG